jgi:lipopolysaccharide transport system permease protein
MLLQQIYYRSSLTVKRYPLHCISSLFYYFCILSYSRLNHKKSLTQNSSNKKTITLSSDVSLRKYLNKCYSYRDLIWELVKKDIKVKYTQTKFGILFSVLQPAIGLILFVYLFGRLLNLGSDGSPYPVFVFIGMISWYYFSYLVSNTGNSLIESQHIIKKVYFPKLILPLSKVFSGLLEFFIWLTILIILLFIYGISPNWHLVFFPAFLILDIITGLTVGIWLSALSFYRRDILHIIPYIIGLTIMVTPVFYPRVTIPESVSFFLYCNPIAGIIQGFRWCVTGYETFSIYYIPCFVVVLLMFYFSMLYFKKVEYRIAEKL